MAKLDPEALNAAMNEGKQVYLVMDDGAVQPLYNLGNISLDGFTADSVEPKPIAKITPHVDVVPKQVIKGNVLGPGVFDESVEISWAAEPVAPPPVADVVPKPGLLFSKALSTAVVLPEISSLPKDADLGLYWTGKPTLLAKTPAAPVVIKQELPGEFPLPTLDGLVKKPTPAQKEMLDGVELVTAVYEDTPAESVISDMLMKHGGWITPNFDAPLPAPGSPTWPSMMEALTKTLKPVVISFQANIVPMAEAIKKSFDQMSVYMSNAYDVDPDMVEDIDDSSNIGRAEKLRRLIPGVDDMVTLPCEHKERKTVWYAIQHLNDAHNPNADHAVGRVPKPEGWDWSRERIADWLETLDADLRVQDPPPEPPARKMFVEPTEAPTFVIGGWVVEKTTGKVGQVVGTLQGYNMDYDQDELHLRVQFSDAVHTLSWRKVLPVPAPSHPPCCPHDNTINGHCTDCMDTGHSHPSDTPQHYGLDVAVPPPVYEDDALNPIPMNVLPNSHEAAVQSYLIELEGKTSVHLAGPHFAPQKHMLGIDWAEPALPEIEDIPAPWTEIGYTAGVDIDSTPTDEKES